MANQKHLKLLARGGVAAWNKWRRKHPTVRPDLSHAKLDCVDLTSADLSGTDFSYAHLSRAILSYAHLSHAHLNGTNLSGANLSSADLNHASLGYANLSRANMSRANLSSADLSHANLTSADLSRANLTSANLTSANLSRAYFNETNLSSANLTTAGFHYTTFAEVDLSHVKGLETVLHLSRSIVDINSVVLPTDEHSRLHFLRGIGFTETQIECLPSRLTGRPTPYSSLFICYASQDEVIAKRLHADLHKNDVPCWFAPHNLQPSHPFLEHIDYAIHTQDKVLLLLSEHSIESAWIRSEVELALAREIAQDCTLLFPLRLDQAVMQTSKDWATRLRESRYIGDLTGWTDDTAYQQALTTLLPHLKAAQSPIASS
jgi:uncharacterized protein YjbI with pentapeptide repeats